MVTRIDLSTLSYSQLLDIVQSSYLFAAGAEHIFRFLSTWHSKGKLSIAQHHELCRRLHHRLRSGRLPVIASPKGNMVYSITIGGGGGQPVANLW